MALSCVLGMFPNMFPQATTNIHIQTEFINCPINLLHCVPNMTCSLPSVQIFTFLDSLPEIVIWFFLSNSYLSSGPKLDNITSRETLPGQVWDLLFLLCFQSQGTLPEFRQITNLLLKLPLLLSASGSDLAHGLLFSCDIQN